MSMRTKGQGQLPDIVYLVKVDPDNDSAELRYSLRSLKNIPHRNVYIVGEKPNWVRNITHIPVAQNLTKPENVKNNMHAAVASDDISAEFILMNDDFFFTKPIDVLPTYAFGRMNDVIAQYERRYPEGSPYIDTMKLLYEKLVQGGIADPVSYELHVPMLVRKANIRKLYSEVSGRLYQFRSYYGNYFNIGGETISDVKVFLDNEHNAPEYIADNSAYLSRQTFLSATGGSFKHGVVGAFIRSCFPEKSNYEA